MKKALALTLVLALLFSTMAGTLLVSVGTANFVVTEFPRDPHTTVAVHEVYIQNGNDVNLTVKVDLSEWTPYYFFLSNPYYSFSSSVTCYLDSQPVWETTISNSPQNQVLSVPLTGLFIGTHNITVEAKTNGEHYTQEPDGRGWSYSNATVVDSSDAVTFTVDTTSSSSKSELSSTTFVVAAVVIIAIVTAGLAVYFKKRKR